MEELERRDRERLNGWGSDYTPGSMNIATLDCSDWLKGRLWMAKHLGCVIVGKFVDDKLRVFVVPKEDKR